MSTSPLVAGMVVLYRPGAEVLENVRSYAGQVDVVYAVDNTEESDPSLVSALESVPGLRYLPNRRNLGVATALNIGARRAIDEGYEWLLTMDQDSTATPGMVATTLACLSDPAARNVGLISPVHEQVGGKPLGPRPRCTEISFAMTSGSLVRLSAYAVVGPFMAELFIDQVDNEFCLRLHAAGFGVVEAGEARLTHRVGDVRRHRFPVPMFSSNHPPVRRYYATRNRLHVGRTYRDQFPWFRQLQLREIGKDVFKILLHEDQKLAKLGMMALGFRDYRRCRLGPYAQQR